MDMSASDELKAVANKDLYKVSPQKGRTPLPTHELVTEGFGHTFSDEVASMDSSSEACSSHDKAKQLHIQMKKENLRAESAAYLRFYKPNFPDVKQSTTLLPLATTHGHHNPADDIVMGSTNDSNISNPFLSLSLHQGNFYIISKLRNNDFDVAPNDTLENVKIGKAYHHDEACDTKLILRTREKVSAMTDDMALEPRDAGNADNVEIGEAQVISGSLDRNVVTNYNGVNDSLDTSRNFGGIKAQAVLAASEKTTPNAEGTHGGLVQISTISKPNENGSSKSTIPIQGIAALSKKNVVNPKKLDFSCVSETERVSVDVADKSQVANLDAKEQVKTDDKRSLPTELWAKIYEFSLDDRKNCAVFEFTYSNEELQLCNKPEVPIAAHICSLGRSEVLRLGFRQLSIPTFFNPKTDILYFKEPAVLQTEITEAGALKPFGATQKVAFAIIDTLALLYTHFRLVKQIIITVPARPVALLQPQVRTENTEKLFTVDELLTKDQLLRFNDVKVHWSYIAREIHQIMKNDLFWSDVNREYKRNNLRRLERNPSLPSIIIAGDEGIHYKTKKRFSKYLREGQRHHQWHYPGDTVIEELREPTWKHLNNSEWSFQENWGDDPGEALGDYL
ncbi:uncharacterized protein BCR38DRAFT_488427 [Pseudomassariella vexata]|uniref:Uncharacterized protein n=1 Tax=Pseudomassariella vexata TaxID=1141098 RepID=A0A1Y2DNK9_9PEZI|nr:uncharacterized protein BCR38DRAFT_488427 [Pseudomassariella vexata]ORY60245.1 hypothetical protein BCR38DRAFT_488427 [Pseudomassariella vexata]